MPWKGIRDPYRIWLSEIILQQTRVAQGEKYYLRFVERYPTLSDLALSTDEDVFKLWEGLGYYSRCRNLLHTARYIQFHHQGVFPNTYQGILALKGIGEYTAAAIASFAFDLPHAVVDGNVVRILSRVFAVEDDFTSTSGKKRFQSLAQSLLPVDRAAAYNQAIMDLGALICKPRSPQCGICPLQKICKSYQQGNMEDFPKKKEKKALKQRHFHFLCIEDGENLYLVRRHEKDIWKDLHTPYLLESENNEKPDFSILKKSMEPICFMELKQILTHQEINGYFYQVRSSDVKKTELQKLLIIPRSRIGNFAFPRMIVSFFQKTDYL
jgi:A/G-specific adenine glycosylase